MEVTVSNRTIIRVLFIALLFVLGGWFVIVLKTQLIWIFSAVFLALALEPAVSWLSRWLPGRSRGLAVGAVLMAVVALLAFIIFALIPPFAAQLYHLIESLPDAYQQFVKDNPAIGNFIDQRLTTDAATSGLKQFSNQLLSAGGSAVGIVKGIFGGIVALLTVLLLTFFMVLEGPRWTKAVWARVPSGRRAKYQPLVQQLHGTVTGFVGGIVLTGTIAAVVSTVVLLLIGSPYALALGLLVGVVELVPMIGATIAGVLVVMAVLVFKGVGTALVMAGFFIGYQLFENYVLQPIVFAKALEVSPLIVLLSLIIGASLAGFVGALVAIPAAASAQILLRYYLNKNNPKSKAKPT